MRFAGDVIGKRLSFNEIEMQVIDVRDGNVHLKECIEFKGMPVISCTPPCTVAVTEKEFENLINYHAGVEEYKETFSE